MINFRKLRQDFSSSILKEGKELYDKKSVVDPKILEFNGGSIRLRSRVKGAFENSYEIEIEIDRSESVAIDSNCDCTYPSDCQHIAALIYHLEVNLNEIVVAYSQGTDLEKNKEIDEESKQELRNTFEVAANKEGARRDQKYQKEVLREYLGAAQQLGGSPFFLPQVALQEDSAELAVIFTNQPREGAEKTSCTEIQLALRLPMRSKPLYIPNVRMFLDAVRYGEPLSISGKRYFFTPHSFGPVHQELLNMIIYHARFHLGNDDRHLRFAQLDPESVGAILACAYDLAISNKVIIKGIERETPLPCFHNGHLEEPLFFSTCPAQTLFTLDYLNVTGPTLLLKPLIKVDEETIHLDQILLFESVKPGLIYKNTYYRFAHQIKRIHLKSLIHLQQITIPEPLFGTFIENALPILRQFAEVTNPDIIRKFVTLPHVEPVKGRCSISYLNGELEAKLYFSYGHVEIPASFSQLAYEDVATFIGKEGILARNLVEERKLIEDIFEDFFYDEKEGAFRAKSEKKIVEFMTEVLPHFQNQIHFECPENLLEQFLYDDSSFELHFRESQRIDTYEVELKVEGHLKGTTLDLLWDCIAAKKCYVELASNSRNNKLNRGKNPRILILDLEKIAPIVQIFDEIGLTKIDNHIAERPLWNLASVHATQFHSLPVKFKMNSRLQEIQSQILGESPFEPSPIPPQIQANLRNYQIDGVHWLEKLRRMHLNGILADDMGLGKTLQAIIAITQSKMEDNTCQSLIVCPTSLVYNWKEEFHKFNPQLKILVIDATPSQRKKLLKDIARYDVVITSYNLLQKDIDICKDLKFDYVILDEAQNIKNRGTRNAKSVKMIQAKHRLILTGTPIENSLEELWSLFDFLMPGLLSSFDRFVEKYIRNCGHTEHKADNLETLKKKVSPFILRRMKCDVLDDLPPISEILYHCHLTKIQKDLYNAYATSAKEELSRLVKKEGFDRIQIHVLATLTRLKQICCHPAIFAKEKAEPGDSAKYDMLMELIPTLIEGNHKTVIFSQYTKMLTILREDLTQQGIPFSYLDGSSKNRLNIVNQFNEDPAIPIFLVSLKAGGSGLNLVGADTVIHYDMWWNPAVERQATDRVQRLGQKKPVSVYNLITLDTIEEKILLRQNKKKKLATKVISSDDEAIYDLTWEEVLEILQIGYDAKQESFGLASPT